MQQFENPTPGVTGGHQGSQWAQATAAFLVTAYTQKDVIEKVHAIFAALKQTKALG